MPEVFEVSDQLSRRFSSGCILCGKMVTWRFKVLDSQNLPLEMCIDCLLKQRCIHCRHTFEPKEGSNVKDEVSKGKRMEKPKPSHAGSKDTEQQIEGEELNAGDEPEDDVEG